MRKYLRTDKAEPPQYRRRAVATKLAPFVEAVKMALLADARRPRKERRTAKALHKQIADAGYEGGYTRLTDFIRDWRAQQGGITVGKAFVPLAFELGEAFQFDWSDEPLVIAGIYRKLQVSHMKLCASRAFWLVAYPSQGHEMLFDAHTRSFAALGGVDRRGIYDNMRTAVDKVHKGKGAPSTPASRHVRALPVRPRLLQCRVGLGERGVEKSVQDSRRRIWIDAREQRFFSLEALNAWLGERCRALWQEVKHPEHKQFSIAEMLEHERGN
ncbi:MAG: IS21 family transposase [Ramlibacter sp.]|nr:IS21 family transposase [Ramlibacter sp.]